METNSKNTLFVTEVVASKQVKNVMEVLIIGHFSEKLLHILLDDGIDEAVKQAEQIVRDEIGDEHIKGKIHYSCVRTDDEMNIEFVRHAHGGGNNPSRRETGGVVVATIKTVRVRGKLSAIHGFTWNNPDNSDPFKNLLNI